MREREANQGAGRLDEQEHSADQHQALADEREALANERESKANLREKWLDDQERFLDRKAIDDSQWRLRYNLPPIAASRLAQRAQCRPPWTDQDGKYRAHLLADLRQEIERSKAIRRNAHAVLAAIAATEEEIARQQDKMAAEWPHNADKYQEFADKARARAQRIRTILRNHRLASPCPTAPRRKIFGVPESVVRQLTLAGPERSSRCQTTSRKCSYKCCIAAGGQPSPTQQEADVWSRRFPPPPPPPPHHARLTLRIVTTGGATGPV